MQRFAKMPTWFAGLGVQAIDPVVPGPEIYFPVRDTRARLHMVADFKVPEFVTRARVETIKFAPEILVHAVADIKSAVGETWRGKHVLHTAFVVESPKPLAGKLVQTINGTYRGKADVMDDAHKNSIIGHQR
jgi:hypothetical protein